MNPMEVIMQMILTGKRPQEIVQQAVQFNLNPQMLEQHILQQNPQLQILSNQMKQSGLNPIQFILQYAKQNNMPIQQNQIDNLFNQTMNIVNQKRY